MPRIAMNAYTADLRAELNLGQCFNVTVLDQVALVVSLDCLQVVIFEPHQIFKEDK